MTTRTGLAVTAFPPQSVHQPIRPTLYATFGQACFLSAAWNAQAWGAVAGSSGALDVVNFERQRGKLRLGVTF
jgi:hypothetical protein